MAIIGSEVQCNFYKKDTGKWYGEYSFMSDIRYPFQLTDEMMIEECTSVCTNPQEFIIQITYKGVSWLIIPK